MVDLVVTRVWLVHWALVSLKIIQVSKKIQNAGKIQSAGRIQNAGNFHSKTKSDRLFLSAIFTPLTLTGKSEKIRNAGKLHPNLGLIPRKLCEYLRIFSVTIAVIDFGVNESALFARKSLTLLAESHIR